MNTVVVGAGQAGLAMSRCLQREGLSHVVLERDSVGSSWRKRWDSFHLNTPNQINLLPDAPMAGERDGFLARDSWVEALETYHSTHDLPIRTGVEVQSIRPIDDGFEIECSDGRLHSHNVVLCSGDQNVPRVPSLAKSLPEDIEQLHSERYRSASELPAGAVLVVGSGQTGVQIAEDLLEAGRTVWLCTSKVGRVPRRYRGRDITEWVGITGMAEHRPGDVPDEERSAPQGMISGTLGGHSVNLHSLGNAGARLLGRLAGVEGRALRVESDLLANVARGDVGVENLRTALDTFIEKAGIDAPPAEPDPADEPCPKLEQMATLRTVDLDAENIRSIIWATGFGGDFRYLPAQLADDRGMPRHTEGVCTPGLYCLGFLWLRKRVSGLITGVGDDAEFILEQIKDRGRT